MLRYETIFVTRPADARLRSVCRVRVRKVGAGERLGRQMLSDGLVKLALIEIS